MGSLKDSVYDVLAADAQLTGGTNLGDYLAQTTAAPYGIYFRNPPANKDLTANSVVTYFINSMAGRFPRDIYLNVTAWGDNFEDILNRVYALLHDTKLTGLSDYTLVMMKWDNSGPELYDDDLKVYFQQQRYWLKGLKS